MFCVHCEIFYIVMMYLTKHQLQFEFFDEENRLRVTKHEITFKSCEKSLFNAGQVNIHFGKRCVDELMLLILLLCCSLLARIFTRKVIR